MGSCLDRDHGPPERGTRLEWPEWVVFHVPHASQVIPVEARSAFLLADEELQAELDRLTDHYVDILFAPSDGEAVAVTAAVSRFVVDVERFLDAEHEPMAKVGMGAIYMRTTDGRPLRRALTDNEERNLLDAHYRPHHCHLTAAVDRALDERGRALILDFHSFPDTPLACDMDQTPLRPDICVGTDAFHTPQALVEALTRHFVAAGFTVEINRPYSGTIVPLRHYRRQPRVASVMVEVNRRLYLEPGTVCLVEDAGEIGSIVQAAVHGAVVDWVASSAFLGQG